MGHHMTPGGRANTGCIGVLFHRALGDSIAREGPPTPLRTYNSELLRKPVGRPSSGVSSGTTGQAAADRLWGGEGLPLDVTTWSTSG